MHGILSPVVTPFHVDYTIDHQRLITQCKWLIDQDCGLAVFGTNSEGNSLSLSEKQETLDKLIAAGLPPERMMPGTGHCSASDTVTLSRHAVESGCGGVLMLPPFFYKGVSDEGLFRSISTVIDKIGDDRLRVYLYHIPPVAQVGFSLDLIERLIDAYPDVVAGIKDSSGDWGNTRAMLDRFPGWGIFCGNEFNLAEAIELGSAGCISATCNVNTAAIVNLHKNAGSTDAATLQESVNRTRRMIDKYPMIPALKAIVARGTKNPEWERVRPPLVELTDAQKSGLFADLDGLGFDMGFDMEGGRSYQ
jgi:4-hydroxy-tetrahydrodipicolinate synthase